LGALLAEGLEAVHTAGLLHRDLKPQNIMLGSDGPMIIDFGLGAFLDSSKDSLTQSGMIIGTIRCMPPEQASGNPHVTPAADVYALGTVLLYASTGHYPYDGIRWEAIAAQITNTQVEPNLSEVPVGLAPLITSMLAHSPEDRPTLAQVAAACADLLVRAGLTPADARRSLIAATKTTTDPARSPTALSPSMEKRIEEQAASGNDEVSPLDALPPEPEGEEAAPSPPEEEEPGSPGRPRPRRGRPPASERIADELRAQYGVQSSL
jgi:serine/threonine protein kinase